MRPFDSKCDKSVTDQSGNFSILSNVYFVHISHVAVVVHSYPLFISTVAAAAAAAAGPERSVNTVTAGAALYFVRFSVMKLLL